MEQVFADDWLKDLAAFRRAPRPFLTSRRISPDSMVLDILQMLCSECAEVIKISLLGVLQEHLDVLFSDALSVEHTFASLKDMFEQSEGSNEVNFRAQYLSEIDFRLDCLKQIARDLCFRLILTTLSTLAVSFDFMTSQAQLFGGFISTLLTSLSKVNAHDRAAVRSGTCHSLRELELMYPGLLAVKLGHFFVMANMEQSYVAQDYMMLAVTVMQHVLHMVITDTQWHTEQSLNHWLTSRSEPLLPYCLPESLPELDADSKARLSLGSLLPGLVDTKELRRAVSIVMEFAPLMTPECHLLAIRELMDCVRWTGLAPTTFKHVLLRNLATSSLPFLHLAIQLKMKFPTDFLEPEEEELLLDRLLIFGDHRDIPYEQRLLAYQFLRRYPSQGLGQTIIPSEDCFMAGLDEPARNHIFPMLFDNDAMMQMKLDTLSLLLLAESSTCGGGGAPAHGNLNLMAQLGCLHKPLQYGVRGRVAVALYRIVFAFYKRHGASSVADDIYELLVKTVTQHPCYTEHTIDFLECVRKTHPDSTLPLKMLQSLGEQTVSIPSPALVKHLPFHLTLLQQVACEPRVDPSAILSYLLQVLHRSTLCQEGNWSIGNKILSICSSALRHHPSSSLYTNVCNLLQLITKNYNDVDIRDRARLYSRLVTSVSSDKLMDLLTQASDGSSASQRLTRLVEVGLMAPSFPPATPMQNVGDCLLKLTRIPRGVVRELPTHDYRQQPLAMANASGPDLLSWYVQQVQSPTHQLKVGLPCLLHYVSRGHDCLYQSESCVFKPEFARIYAVAIHLTTSANYSTITACAPVTLELCPLSPVPALITVSASFSGKNGDTFSTNLADLHITFSDLFLPMDLPPLSSDWSKEEKECARQVMFEHLWSGLVDETCGLKYIQSVVCLSNSRQATMQHIRQELCDVIILDTEELVLMAIALPPKHTLLMRASSNEGRCVISLVTDIWEILPFVERFLQGLDQR